MFRILIMTLHDINPKLGSEQIEKPLQYKGFLIGKTKSFIRNIRKWGEVSLCCEKSLLKATKLKKKYRYDDDSTFT